MSDRLSGDARYFSCAKDHGNGFATAADEFVDISAYDPQQAATRFAQRYDQSGDYEFLQHGGGVIVTNGKDWWRVEVWGEGVPTYHAASVFQNVQPGKENA